VPDGWMCPTVGKLLIAATHLRWATSRLEAQVWNRDAMPQRILEKYASGDTVQ
jgi:hypothetical protein